MAILTLCACKAANPDNAEPSFRFDSNEIKYIDDTTGLVKETHPLEYFWSIETGGYTSKTFTGKLCTALHPDQFYEHCYLSKFRRLILVI